MTGSRGGAEEPKVFSFDHIFDQADAQADVYAALGPPVLQMLQRGHNASVFAYGQTGSGKTYTMLGTEEAQGLVPRLCESLFDPLQFGAAWGASLASTLTLTLTLTLTPILTAPPQASRLASSRSTTSRCSTCSAYP